VFDTASFAIFVSASLALLITPGPAIIYTVSRSIDEGKRAGFLSVLGIALGSFPHALAVALGVAAILASSVVMFSLLKYVGAGYLVYLGICRLRRRGFDTGTAAKKPRTGAAAFFQSFAVGLFNPKGALFNFAFLPQFVDPSYGYPALQTLALWLISQLLAVMTGGGYVLAATALRRLIIRRRGFATAGRYVTGSIYLGLGLAAALTGSKGK